MSTRREPLPIAPNWIEIRAPSGKLLGRYHPGDDRLWLRNGRDEAFVCLSDLKARTPR